MVGVEKKLLRDFGKSLDHEFDFSTNQIAAFGPNADKK